MADPVWPSGVVTQEVPVEAALAERCFRLMPEPHKPDAGELRALGLAYLPMIGDTVSDWQDGLVRKWPKGPGKALLAVEDVETRGDPRRRFRRAWQLWWSEDGCPEPFLGGRFLIFPDRDGPFWYSDHGEGAGVACAPGDAARIVDADVDTHLTAQETLAGHYLDVEERAFWLAVCLNARAAIRRS